MIATMRAIQVMLCQISTGPKDIPSMPRSFAIAPFVAVLLHLEIDGQNEIDVDGTAALRRGPERPPLHGVDRGLVEAHRQALEHAHVLDLTGAVDDRFDDD